MYDIPVKIPSVPVKFMGRLRAFIRTKRLAYKTEQTYILWIQHFIFSITDAIPR